MFQTTETLVFLLFVIAAVSAIAQRLKVPPAILLVLTGVIFALMPRLPAVQLAPEVVLLLVLPPVIYAAAVAMSWREFRVSLRPISLLAVGCVVFTTVAAAAATHWLLGLPWAVGFTLGAIISPPDAVAALSILRRMQLPRRLIVILEGEGLANDATALILYRFAVVAVSVGSFSFGHAVGTFAAIVVGEILWGIGVGWTMLRLRHWADGPRTEILLSILTPFLAYWPPEYFGGSGVLATVATGLYFSGNGLRLISAATRLQGIFFWDFFIYVIEGLVFLITGLQARSLIAGISQYPISDLVTSAVVVSGVVILSRFVWMFPIAYLPRGIMRLFWHKHQEPSWQGSFVVAFAGIRGIVSLAAALAIPLVTADGTPFPDRDLILFLTFVVILVTLVGQGLLLPWVIRMLGLAHAGRRERHADKVEEIHARHQAIEAVLRRLDQLTAERQLSQDVVTPLRNRHRDRLRHADDRDGDSRQSQRVATTEEIEFLLIAAERDSINELYRTGQLKDEARRRIERELDLRDAQLANLRAQD
ncbi:Na+/H+ antiporter [Methylovirgula sp. HY1]|uniref:Na+/H+ antiporter n=1 Tax=Methylovirgula sp. HY1 TaxID=2822761 RepID=UPI001C5AE6E2|nr:Na+/H+ antiporter [Methylovirgula sp. HY1]QXX76449.1 Sodium, potassium, lithium and rubidium/H(+) antiporter [Methylovirgula sp. HY1]